ncbi:MAG: SIMPL domain-containing protein [Methanotrichaceae archaeon]|nr:SIMPL domain-containing protein [Methanotrichaceae archaeon]
MKRIILLLAVITLTAFSVFAEEMGYPTLTVVGEGTVIVPADLVYINVGVKSSLLNATSATAEIDQKLNQTIEALIAAGVDSKTILAEGTNSIPSGQSYSKICETVNNISTCETSKSVTIRLQTTDQNEIDKVLNAAKNSNASAMIAAYGLSDPSKAMSAMSDAKEKAVENARDDAQGMASAAGAKLGKVIEISDVPEYAYLGSMSKPFGLESSQPPGTVDVTSHVIVTYEIIG